MSGTEVREEGASEIFRSQERQAFKLTMDAYAQYDNNGHRKSKNITQVEKIRRSREHTQQFAPHSPEGA